VGADDIVRTVSSVWVRVSVKAPAGLTTLSGIEWDDAHRKLSSSVPVSGNVQKQLLDMDIVQRSGGARKGWERAVRELANQSSAHPWAPHEVIIGRHGTTALAGQIADYLNVRQTCLLKARQNLMTLEQAHRCFNEVKSRSLCSVPVRMNKQTGVKARENYLTGIVNHIVAQNSDGMVPDWDPQRLTKITDGRNLAATLSRRVDEAFPSTVDPVAVWELKEYYQTTTFGSRVADGIYEAVLDGYELQPVRQVRSIENLLIVDGYDTWWQLGKSYLCRIIDLLHMGHIDEVLFGREVVERLPDRVKRWCQAASEQAAGRSPRS